MKSKHFMNIDEICIFLKTSVSSLEDFLIVLLCSFVYGSITGIFMAIFINQFINITTIGFLAIHVTFILTFVIIFMLMTYKKADAYEQIKNEHYKNKDNKKINKLNKEKIDKQLEIENEIIRLEQYLNKIKKYKKEPLFKQEIKHIEELIKTYKKLL